MSADTGDGPDIPDRSWRNPFPPEYPLHQLFSERVRNEQDLIMIIDDWHARRGTGKTVASLQLAAALDQTDEGVTRENVSLSPEKVREAYSNLPPRSAIVMDEAEVGASNRQAMTKTNQALREIMSMARVEQKYVIVNAPAKSFIDKDIQMMSDVWICMRRKGYGAVHFVERNPYHDRMFTRCRGYIEFEDIERGSELRDVYNFLTAEKRRRIRGETGAGFIPRDQHEKELEKARETTARKTRNDIIVELYNHPETEVSQRIIGEAVGLTQQGVRSVLKEREGGR